MSGNLPPYSDLPVLMHSLASSHVGRDMSSIAGSAMTCSIRDNQVNYFKIVRETSTSFHICLTVDPTPLYCIKLASEKNSTIAGDVQIFLANKTDASPIAGARLLTLSKNKKDPVAMICTYQPSHSKAIWKPISRPVGFSPLETYLTSIPIVTVPGMAAKEHQFAWRTTVSEPFFELWWHEGPLHFAPRNGWTPDDRDRSYVFATVSRKMDGKGDNVIEIRRGGGLEFEMSVILGLFVILHHSNKQLL